jgi:hypothetical protein
MISPGVQASVSRILILVGLAMFTYGASTYVAWRHCDGRYGAFLMEVDSSIQLRELLRTKDDDKTWSWFRSHRPSGHMYSGWAEMGAVTFAGFVLFALGTLGWMDLRRHGALAPRPKSAEPSASPNRGPTTSIGDSEGTEGPPSAS